LPTEQTCASDDPATRVCRTVIHLRNALLNKLDDALAECDLTAAQYGVLVTLSDLNQATSTQLCDALAYDKGAMSRMLRRLECKALVTRVLQSDKRSQMIALTSSGQTRYEKACGCVSQVYQQSLQDVNESDMKVVENVLTNCLKQL